MAIDLSLILKLQVIKAHIVSILKALLVLAIIGSIYHMLVVQKNLGELVRDMQSYRSSFKYYYLYLAVILVVPNWLLESYKWKSAMDSYGGIGFKESVVSIMSGVTIGIITPARVGEYAGRLIVVGKERYSQALISTFLCSLSQLIITLAIGGVTFMNTFKHFEFEGFSYDLIAYLGIAAFVFLLYAYLDLARVVKLLARNKWVASKLKELVGIDNNFSLQVRLMLLALFRYLVYTTQYFLVLRFCGVEFGWQGLFCHVAIIFFLQSLMPLPPVASFFARTGVALVVLASLNVNELISMTSSMILWVINLTLPALVGLYFIVSRKTLSD